MDKYIYLRRDMKQHGDAIFCNVHLIRCYTQHTIQDYKKLHQVLCTDFPAMDIRTSDVQCHEVRESGHLKGGTLLAWNTNLPPELIEIARTRGYGITDSKPEYKF